MKVGRPKRTALNKGVGGCCHDLDGGLVVALGARGGGGSGAAPGRALSRDGVAAQRSALVRARPLLCLGDCPGGLGPRPASPTCQGLGQGRDGEARRLTNRPLPALQPSRTKKPSPRGIRKRLKAQRGAPLAAPPLVGLSDPDSHPARADTTVQIAEVSEEIWRAAVPAQSGVGEQGTGLVTPSGLRAA